MAMGEKFFHSPIGSGKRVSNLELVYEAEGHSADRISEIKSDILRNFDQFSAEDLWKFKTVVDMIDAVCIEDYNSGKRRINKVVIERTGRCKLNARRSEIEVLASILDVCKCGAGKTKILYTANLSYTQLKNYLSFLLEKGLMEIEERTRNARGKIYLTTPKGLLLLRNWQNIVPLLE